MNKDLNNTVIMSLSEEHGAKIVQYYNDNGYNTGYYTGTMFKSNTTTSYYYGVINDVFDNHGLTYVQENKAKIIELPQKNTYPKVMWVNNFIGETPIKRVVFMKKCDKYIAWIGADTIEKSKQATSTTHWNFAKDIEEESTKIELSMQEIADKFKIDVKLLTIKK